MTAKRESTLPKPFVFVLMPFEDSFSDIYRFGIKGAAEDVGAYAERVDEQIFTEGILDRIFNQISKSDVVVADMTGRNPNVFYEVGYAHALGKITLLLTQRIDDIPFDLKHRQHIVYGGKIEALRKELSERLRWAVEESRHIRRTFRIEQFALFVFGMETVHPGPAVQLPTIAAESPDKEFLIPIQLRNDSVEATNPITHVYLLSKSGAKLIPWESRLYSPKEGYLTSSIAYVGGSVSVPIEPLSKAALDAAGDFDAQYRLPISFPAMPPGAVEVANLQLMFREHEVESDDTFRMRIFSSAGFHDFDFRLNVSLRKKSQGKDGSK